MIRKLPALLCLAIAGCASKSFTPDQAPEYVIIRNYAPFYRMGPMQPGGPDASLPVDTRVKMLSEEMGYSRVQLEDMRTGYVANENLAPAPPKPPEVATSGDQPSGRKKRGPRYTGAQVNDTPLPDPLPPPDLNIAPEIVPEATPTPEPVEPPKFRY
jgi:hypothetical protein